MPANDAGVDACEIAPLRSSVDVLKRSVVNPDILLTVPPTADTGLILLDSVLPNLFTDGEKIAVTFCRSFGAVSA
jgi:hypothetical protein